MLSSRTDSDSVNAAIDHLNESINKNQVNEPSIMSEFDSFYNEPVQQETDSNQIDERADERESAATNETNVSLKSQSPFTSAVKSAIATIEMPNEINEQNSKPYYSCNSFSVIQDVIHLYPLWAGCL